MADVTGPSGTDEDPGGDPPLTFDQRKRIEKQAQRTVSARSGLSVSDIERTIEAAERRQRDREQNFFRLLKEHPRKAIALYPFDMDIGKTLTTRTDIARMKPWIDKETREKVEPKFPDLPNYHLYLYERTTQPTGKDSNMYYDNTWPYVELVINFWRLANPYDYPNIGPRPPAYASTRSSTRSHRRAGSSSTRNYDDSTSDPLPPDTEEDTDTEDEDEERGS